MPNILINPNSGILEFNTGTTGSSSLDASLSGAIRMVFLNSGTLGIQGYSTGTVDRFFVEGVNGRLFEVDDVMTGSLMSVNDIAGLPILEVFSDDRVILGQYNYNTLVVSGTVVNISGRTTIAASSTGNANLNLPHGTAPTSPVNGDVWTTTSGLYARINGSTFELHDKTYAVFKASDNYPPTGNFATLDTRNAIAVLDFDDGATNEESIFISILPLYANVASGLKARIHWMATTGTSGTCRWGAQFADLSDQDLDSYVFAAAVEAGNTTAATAGNPTVTEITVTGIDFISGGKPYAVKIYRDSSDAVNDTMVGDAELLAVEIRSAS